jgi:CRP-like cAMP-binding protein
VLCRGQTLFSRGARHDGIFLIQTGRIRVYYTAPSQREITLAYWHPGNFVGGPDTSESATITTMGRAAE